MDQSAKNHLPKDKSLCGVFTDIESGERAYELLREMGYSDDVSVLISDETRIRYFPGLTGDVFGIARVGGLGFGSMIGAGTGVALGALLGATASLAIPGVVSTITAVLIGAILGGLSGAWLGSLLGIGYSEESAQKSDEKIGQGNVIIGINPHTEEDAENISREWRATGGETVTQERLTDSSVHP